MKYLIIILSIFSMSFTLDSDWKVPASASKMKNPTNINDLEGKSLGKTLWSKYCKSCHGVKGLGDGTKSANLENMPDLSSSSFQNQTDGDLFYKTKVGKGDMPKNKIEDEEDIWLVVNYMRTFKK